MTQDYISYIRSKVGHDKIILTFAGGILTDEKGRVLLQLRGDKETWAIPGGAMELGESSLDTCRREFFEETGIEVEVSHLLNVYTNFEEVYPNGDKVQTVVFLYEVKAVSEIAIENFHNEETKALRFFSEEEIDQLASVSTKHGLMLSEYFSGHFELGH
ncbi:NUDIX hydrolase [Streptococcus oricebi]|uniref:DNA mismatch repair protein MutT n=1 Tax=Streptococcus oricebi TaxID=1547447 RepID=A0ABS5B354_9STRE|nr:NUDIX domain-containing protein [Streptococcus oricebi]MBP2622893.1 DNA mismatch repair protein MutT [Streptococcus oricebi]